MLVCIWLYGMVGNFNWISRISLSTRFFNAAEFRKILSITNEVIQL